MTIELAQDDDAPVGWCLFNRNGHCTWDVRIYTMDPAQWADANAEDEIARLNACWPNEAPFSYQPVYQRKKEPT